MWRHYPGLRYCQEVQEGLRGDKEVEEDKEQARDIAGWKAV
jgi:hypothetical protein